VGTAPYNTQFTGGAVTQPGLCSRALDIHQEYSIGMSFIYQVPNYTCTTDVIILPAYVAQALQLPVNIRSPCSCSYLTTAVHKKSVYFFHHYHSPMHFQGCY